MDIQRVAELAGLLTSDKPVIVQEAGDPVGLYNAALVEINQKMVILNQRVAELANQPEHGVEETHWGHVGDLARLSRDLDDILEYLTGS